MFLKDPDAVLDYRVDWGAVLDEGVALVSSSWRVEPQDDERGLRVEAASTEGPDALVRLAGGVGGRLYRVGNLATFSDGTTDERSLLVRVEER